MGWNDMGYQSTDLAEMTPFMDSLAAQGVKLTGYHTMHICSPARASVMTGRYVFRYGMEYNVLQPLSRSGLPLTEKLLPEYLSENGYSTHMVGKWHLGYYLDDFLPHRRGFETFLGYLTAQEDYYQHTVSAGADSSSDDLLYFDFGFGDRDGYIDKETQLPRDGPSYVGLYGPRVFADRAVRVIEEHAAKNGSEPLFLYFSSQATHAPTNPPPKEWFSTAQLEAFEKIAKLEEIRQWFAKVLTYLDMCVERVVRALEASNMLENTVMVFASDNGGCVSAGGSNYPYRGCKASFWEGGTKVPSFVYAPGLIPPGARGTEYGGLMHVTDWLPTLAGLAGVELDPNIPIDGVDQWAAITGETTVPPRTELIYAYDPYKGDGDGLLHLPAQGAIRVGRWKLLVQEWCGGYYSFLKTDEYNADACSQLGQCWSCGGCYGMLAKKPANYLFDLQADPTEQVNLIDVYPVVARTLYERFMAAGEAATPALQQASMGASTKVFQHHQNWIVPWWSTFISHNSTAGPDEDNPNIPEDHS